MQAFLIVFCCAYPFSGSDGCTVAEQNDKQIGNREGTRSGQHSQHDEKCRREGSHTAEVNKVTQIVSNQSAIHAEREKGRGIWGGQVIRRIDLGECRRNDVRGFTYSSRVE